MSSTTDASRALTKAALEQKHPVVEYFRTDDQKWWDQARTWALQFIPRLPDNYLSARELQLLQAADLVPHEGVDPEAEVVLWVVLAAMVEYYRHNLLKIYPKRSPSPYPTELTIILRELHGAHSKDAPAEKLVETFDKMSRFHQGASTVDQRRELAVRLNRVRNRHHDTAEALRANPDLRIILSGRRTDVMSFSTAELAELERACEIVERWQQELDQGGERLHGLYCQQRFKVQSVSSSNLKRALRKMPPGLLRPLINPVEDEASRKELLLKLEALDWFCRLADEARAEEHMAAA